MSNKQNQKPEPSYYSVITADVRYDKELTPNAKLLYGEISALCKKEGYCWAKNSYFAELYEVSKRSIKSWISKLEERGYVKIKFNEKNNNRRIYLSEVKNINWGKDKPENWGVKKSSRGMKESSQGGEDNFTGGNSPDMQGDRADEQKKSSNNTTNITKDTVSSKEQQSQNKNEQKNKHSFGNLFKSKSLKVLREKHPNHPIPTKRIHTVKQLLEEGLPDEVTAYLIEYVCENSSGVFKPNYAEAIGNHWLSENIKTVEEAKKQIKEFREANKPAKGKKSKYKDFKLQEEERENEMMRNLYQKYEKEGASK